MIWQNRFRYLHHISTLRVILEAYFPLVRIDCVLSDFSGRIFSRQKKNPSAEVHWWDKLILFSWESVHKKITRAQKLNLFQYQCVIKVRDNTNYYCTSYVYQEDWMWIRQHNTATSMSGKNKPNKCFCRPQFIACFTITTAECHKWWRREICLFSCK